MFKNLFNKKANSEKVIASIEKYDGTIYRGVFKIDGKVYEGAYVKDGVRTFITNDGVASISKGIKIIQLESKPVSSQVEHFIDCLKNNWCTPFIHIA